MEEDTPRNMIDPVEAGRAGGLSRARNMTKRARSASASAAAKARWAKAGKKAGKPVPRKKAK